MASPSRAPRVFASKPFMRFARRFGISDAELWHAVNGEFDDDLGGGVFKFRLARHGEGTSGGARAIVAMKVGLRIVLMFRFEKKDQANIKANEVRAFRKAARVYLSYSEEEMTAIVRQKVLMEIIQPSPERGERHGKSV
jgi:hypothetical protein